MENFLPNDENRRVILSADGSVRRIIANYQGRDILFSVSVKDGQFHRRLTPEMPFFEIPKDKLPQIYRQVASIIYDYRKNAKLAQEVKRPEWKHSLEKCSTEILPDGKIIIPRWVMGKDGARRCIRQTVKDVNAAIRMQDHILEKYGRRVEAENGGDLPAEIISVLKKFALIRPHLELRRQLLIYAQEQMEASVREALARLNKIMAATAEKGSGRHHVLADKISRLCFFLHNNWARPYLAGVEYAITTLRQAKRAMGKAPIQTTQLLLLRAKCRLASLIDSGRPGGSSRLAKLAEIDPIKTLAEINRLGKAKEVMATAKRLMPGRIFHLDDLLAISRLVIAGKTFHPAMEQTLLDF